MSQNGVNGIKLSEWAELNGVAYRTALRRFKAGQLPCRAFQFPTGTIIVYPDDPVNPEKVERVALYARVSPPKGKDDLAKQMDRLRLFAAAKGLCVDVEKSEVWTGVEPRAEKNQPAFYEILEDPTITTLIVEHIYRLPILGLQGFISALRGTPKTLFVASDVDEYRNREELDDSLQFVFDTAEDFEDGDLHFIAWGDQQLHKALNKVVADDTAFKAEQVERHQKDLEIQKEMQRRAEEGGYENFKSPETTRHDQMAQDHDAQAKRVKERLERSDIEDMLGDV